MPKKTPRKPQTAPSSRAGLIEKPPQSRPSAVAVAIIVVAGLAAYYNSLATPFIFDDISGIVENTTIRRLWPPWEALSPPPETTATDRPVLNLTFAINYAIHGLDAFGFHVTNLAIHLTAALLLFGVLRHTLVRTSLRPVALELAATATLLWTVHPLQTESVTYVVQRAESLVGMLYLLTMYCAVRGFDSGDSPRGRWWLVAAVAACAVGMGAKEVMVTAPVAVLLYDLTFVERSWRDVFRRRWPFYAGLAATWGVLAMLLAHSTKNAMPGFGLRHEWWEYAAAQPGVILYYLWLAFWPRWLCLDYWWPLDQPAWQTVAASAPVLLLVGLSLWGLCRRKWWAFAGAWFFLILLPTSSVVPIGDAAFEHRMYLPIAALAALVTVGGYVAARRVFGDNARANAVALAVAVAAAAALGYRTHLRNIDYRSDLDMWRDVVAQRPTNARANYNVGSALADLGRVQEAIPYYNRAIELKPDFAEAEYNLGVALMEAGRTPDAIGHYERAVQLKPDYAKAENNLGAALIGMGRAQDAIPHYERAVQLKPDFAEAEYNLGRALAEVGRMPDAIPHYERALELRPDYPKAENHLGRALAAVGRTQDAIRHFERALQLKPDYAEARNNLAKIRTLQGK